MRLYKVTGLDGKAIYGGSGKWVEGRWRTIKGRLIPCKNGLHLCRGEDLVIWLGPEIWEAEVAEDAETQVSDGLAVVSKARVIRRLPWDEDKARSFAIDCAEHVLPLVDPGNDVPRRTIELARADEIGWKEARHAGRAAATMADAAWAAARAIAWCGIEAPYDSARVTATFAVQASSWSGRWSEERAWQTARLSEYLGEPL